MTEAYVLINCELGHENEIIAEIKKIEGIVNVFGVYGVYDIMVKIKAESIEKLKDIVTTRIRKIEKIKSTLTLIEITK
ncbi:MAG: AsnC family transcriptional regulator [Nitrososphaeraceae archaeon]|nr:AsnC family transcriptional regulator [Nitrososphaeraceae archaeon]